MSKFYVYPIKRGKIVKGFCPTECCVDTLASEVGSLYMNCIRFNIDFDDIKVEQL